MNDLKEVYQQKEAIQVDPLSFHALTFNHTDLDGCLEHFGLLTVTSAGAPDGVLLIELL